MNALVICSANNNVDNHYKDLARKVSRCLAAYDFDLVFGGSPDSLMGACYEAFSEEGRIIYAYAIEKYKDDLKHLQSAEWIVCETPFDRKKQMMNEADLIVCLPGGIGTLAELLSYIEEMQCSDKKIPIQIYDEDNFYKKFFMLIEELREKKFVADNIYEYFDVSHNINDFRDHLEKNMFKRKVK